MGRMKMITYAKCSDRTTSVCTGFGDDDDYASYLSGGMMDTLEACDYGNSDKFRSGNGDCTGHPGDLYGCSTTGFDKGPKPKRSRRSRRKFT